MLGKSKKAKICRLLLLIVVVLLVVYFAQQPKNDREWTEDQRLLPQAEITGDSVTLKNVRNFVYRSTKDYDIEYYDKTYDLNALETVDYIVVPFGGIGAAHTFLSFGFSTGDYVSVSVEIRKEEGEFYTPLRGFFRNYEIMYVVADERDVIKLRTNFRENDVYLYPIKTDTEKVRELFLDVFERVNELVEEPEFYNTLTNSCTSNVAQHVNKISPNRIPFDLRLILPKNSDMLAYELGLIDTELPVEQLRDGHNITPIAQEHGDSEEFSLRIRGK